MPHGSHTVDLALDAWRRRKWLALAVFAAVSGAAVTAALSLPNLYRAAATVLVEREQVSEAFVRPSVTAELETRLQTIREDVMSRSRLSDLIASLGLYSNLRSRVPIDALVARMRREIELDVKGSESPASGRTSTISFSLNYTGGDPATAANVANALADLYVQENTKLREGQASRTAEFLRAQLADAKKELDEYDRRADEFRLRHIGELPQQIQANLASLERLNTQLRLNGDNQIRVLDRRERIERQRADVAAAPSPQAAPAEDERVVKLRAQLDDLRRRFTDAYPDVARVRADLEALTHNATSRPSEQRPSVARDEVSRLTEALSDADAELRGLKEEERVLRQTISSYEERVDNVPQRQQEFQAITRDYEAVKERYDTLAKRYEEAQLAESLEQRRSVEQFRVLDPALPPRDPIAPNRLRLLVFGLALAIGLAVGSVYVVESFDTAFHRSDDLRAFISVPLIGRVPLISSRAQLRRSRLRFALTAMSAAAAVALVMAASRYVAHGNEQLVRLMERSRG
jgi:succinoglycan biosynthesis transport protein ExoP